MKAEWVCFLCGACIITGAVFGISSVTCASPSYRTINISFSSFTTIDANVTYFTEIINKTCIPENMMMYKWYLLGGIPPFGVNGIYVHEDKYYCVWTKGREEAEINKTVDHERLHAYIDTKEGYEHFCGGTK